MIIDKKCISVCSVSFKAIEWGSMMLTNNRLDLKFCSTDCDVRYNKDGHNITKGRFLTDLHLVPENLV